MISTRRSLTEAGLARHVVDSRRYSRECQGIDFSRLAAREQVVVVVINYRLGPFGWFAHPALNGADLTSPALANFGTLDMLEALSWTQQNIEAFSGNAGNVTVFGESAGGRNVFSLLASPLAEGLFHGAIAQSGHVKASRWGRLITKQNKTRW